MSDKPIEVDYDSDDAKSTATGISAYSNKTRHGGTVSAAAAYGEVSTEEKLRRLEALHQDNLKKLSDSRAYLQNRTDAWRKEKDRADEAQILLTTERHRAYELEKSVLDLKETIRELKTKVNIDETLAADAASAAGQDMKERMPSKKHDIATSLRRNYDKAVQLRDRQQMINLWLASELTESAEMNLMRAQLYILHTALKDISLRKIALSCGKNLEQGYSCDALFCDADHWCELVHDIVQVEIGGAVKGEQSPLARLLIAEINIVSAITFLEDQFQKTLLANVTGRKNRRSRQDEELVEAYHQDTRSAASAAAAPPRSSDKDSLSRTESVVLKSLVPSPAEEDIKIPDHQVPFDTTMKPSIEAKIPDCDKKFYLPANYADQFKQPAPLSLS